MLFYKDYICSIFQSLIRQSAGPKEIQKILDFNIGLLSRLLQLLDHEQTSIVSVALGAITEIAASGSQRHKRMILVDSLIPVLVKFLNDAIPGHVYATKLLCIFTSAILKTRAASSIDSLFTKQVVGAMLNGLANGYFVCKTNAAKAITAIARGILYTLMLHLF